MCYLVFICLLSLCASATFTETPLYIDNVHLVMMNHLDLGFADNNAADIGKPDGTILNVVNTYFHQYFPFAIDVGRNISKFYNKTFIWSTHSWLISLFLDCPTFIVGLQCPTKEEKINVITGIKQGYLIWNAFPFNSQQELYDKSMVEYGLFLSKQVSKELNVSISKVLSQRDVPGTTRNLIPILKKNDIYGISIGCNPDSAPPATPRIFNWLDPVSQQSIITWLHPGGYGAIPGLNGINISDAVIINNFNHALMTIFKVDNSGPPSVDEVLNYYNILETLFPNVNISNIYASTFTKFLDQLLLRPDIIEQLDIISDEMGDTWIEGPASDPLKMSLLRCAQRERSKCLYQNKCNINDIDFNHFSRFLLKGGEHSFGGDIKDYLVTWNETSAYYNWSNKEFYKRLKENNGNNSLTVFRSTWYEQREWALNYSMYSLSLSNDSGNIELYKNIQKEWDKIYKPSSPLNDNYNLIQNASKEFIVKNDQYRIRFDVNSNGNKTGGIMKLYDIKNNIEYATINNLFGSFIYQTLTEYDFNNTYINKYILNMPPQQYIYYDYGKTRLQSNANPMHQYVNSKFYKLYQNKYNLDEFIIEMNFAEKQDDLIENYGIPHIIYNKINFNTTNDVTFNMELTLINKTKTRIPEVLWFSFDPFQCESWNIDVVEEAIDLTHIMQNGSYHLKATSGNTTCSVLYPEIDKFVKIKSIDAAVVGFKPDGMNEYDPFPTPFNYSNNTKFGTAFMLFATIWGTNYPVWYPFHDNDQNMTYRFEIFLT